MEIQRPQLIKTIRIILIILSASMIIGNGMGVRIALAYDDANFLVICLVMVAIGISYLLGTVFLGKYKLWSNRLITALTGLLVCLIWFLMIFIQPKVIEHGGSGIANIWPMMVAVFWTAPLFILIWFLNRRETIRHFD